MKRLYEIDVYVDVNGDRLSMYTDVYASNEQEAIEKSYTNLKYLAYQKLGTIDGKYGVRFCRPIK